MISEIIIQDAKPDSVIFSFTDPVHGLNHILSTNSQSVNKKSVLFLDINMPFMTGWELMEQIEKADSVVRNNLLIYIFSSSVNPSDITKAKENINIIDFIEKPLTTEFIESIEV